MSDSDYIPADKRIDLMFPCDCESENTDLNIHMEDCSSLRCVEDDMLLDSHAVADDVIRELYEALQDVVFDLSGHQSVPHWYHNANKALARVDALGVEK